MGEQALRGVSSMATRLVLREVCADYRVRTGVAAAIESVGGVDAARRVSAGEPFDFVVLSSEAIDKLIASGHVVAGSRVDLVRSPVAIAVPEGLSMPDISTEQAVRSAVAAATRVGYSTGPSGSALLELLERWGIVDDGRLVQAPPGVPVGMLVARRVVELGFQQRSELVHVPGITIVGDLPAAISVVTIFSGGLCSAGSRTSEARALLDFLARSPTADAAKRRHGMAPAERLTA